MNEINQHDDEQRRKTIEILLSMAKFVTHDVNINEHTVKVFLDSGSQSNFKTSKMATINPRFIGPNINRSLTSISKSFCNIIGVIFCKIKSLLIALSAYLEVLVLVKLTGNLNSKIADPK